MRVWECKIGGGNIFELPDDADQPMRQAVERAYLELTGEYPDFCESGWGGELDPAGKEEADL